MSDKIQAALEARKTRKKKEEESFAEKQKKSQKKIDSALQARETRISSNLQTTISDLNNSINAEIEAAKKISVPSWGGGTEALKTSLEATRQNSINVDNLIRKVEAHRKYLGDKSTDSVLSVLDNIKNTYNDYVSVAEARSKFESEDDYNEAVKEQEDYEAMITLDLDIEQKELELWEKDYERIMNDGEWRNSGDDWRIGSSGYWEVPYSATSVEDFVGKSLAEVEQMVNERRQYFERAKLAQEGIKLGGVSNTESEYYDVDFDKYAVFTEEESPIIPEYKDIVYNYVNGVRDGSLSVATAWGGISDSESARLSSIEEMNDDEKAVYNYYYNKSGYEAAEHYLDAIMDSLNARKGAKDFKDIEDKWILEILHMAASGVDNANQGFTNWFNDEGKYKPPTAMQYEANMAREDLAEDYGNVGEIGADLSQTIGNMIPSILVSKVTGNLLAGAGYVNAAGQLTKGAANISKLAGVSTLGTSAAGNGYQEMINLGYDKSQARAYGTLVGLSEAGLEYALGGISSLGGKFSGGLTDTIVTKLVSKVDKAIFKVAIGTGGKLVGSMLSEFGEEYLQEVLSPVFKNIALGINEKVSLFSSEALYSGFLGALSAGFLEGRSTISGEVSTYKQGKAVKDAGQLSNLKKLGTSFSADTVAYKLASKIDENTDAYTIGQLLHEAGADNLSAANIEEIANALESKGVTPGHAQTIANWLNKAVEGRYFNKFQRMALENNPVIAQVFKEVIIDQNSTVNQRTQGYKDILKNLAEEKVNKKAAEDKANAETSPQTAPVVPYSQEYIDGVAKEFEAMGLPTAEAQAMAKAQLLNGGQVKSSPTDENAAESEYEVSAEGKTINKNTDKVVNIRNFESISESGEAKLNLDDGMVVKASDLAYGSATERAIIEGISSIKIGKKHINAKSANALYMTAMEAWKKNPNMTAEEAMELVTGLAESYTYGAYNLGTEKLTETDSSGRAIHYAGELSEAQRNFAYNVGTQDKADKVDADQKVIDELKEKAKAKTNDTTTKPTAKKGRVRFENGVVAKSKNQKRAVALAKHLARAMGIDIVFYDAKTTTNENGKDANGYYDPKTDTIYLDLQNSWDDAKTIAYTMSHELVHFIKKWSPNKFETFAKFLMKQYGEHGVDTAKLLSNKMEELGTTDKDYAYEEMICDACETLLLDSNAVVKLMELRKSDLELFDKIKLFIRNLLNKIRDSYKKLGLKPTSNEAKALLEMTDVLEQIYSMFEEAAVDATQSYQAVSTLQTESVSVSEDGTVMMQMKQYQQTGRSTLLKYLKEQYGEDDANNLISTIDNIYDTMKDIKKDEALTVFSNWQDSEIELDENGHPIFTTSINNGDYELNQDFSRVCKKRRQLDFVLNMLAEDPAFEASNLTKQDFVKINKAIKEHGFEIACALCFVDSKRFRQAEWADSFANTWNDILYSVVDDKSKLTPFNFATKTPNLADDGIEIDTSKPVMYRKWSEGKEDVKNRRNYDSFDMMLSKDGNKWMEGNTNVRTIATLIRDNPNLRHTFRGADIIASKGFDTIQRLAPGIRGILDGWGGSSVPKPSSSDASYDSSIINLSGYNKETAYAMGGARMNSFSDFMAHMFFDYCQAFADLAAKELPSQAYTKELVYVRLFGRSGQKINMSGIAAIRDDALPTTAQKGVTKAEAEANEKIEKMVAGLDVSRLLEHLNKDIHQLTEADVEQFLDMCDYVWADESINMKHATLLQSGILYDKLSDSKIEECYELLKAGEIEQALEVAGKENVDTEYAKHCGTIVVGVSDAHIRKLLRDPTVRMVIPYHKSGLNPVIARELKISAYNDYTLTQTTGVKRKGAKATAKIGSDEIKSAYGLKDFSFYDWFGKTIDGKVYDGKATADKYLEWCEKGYYDENVGDYVYYTTKGDGYILAKEFHKKATIVPKFEAFVGEENYYKVLEDFDCYNTITGEHSEQGAVDFLRNGLPSDYKDVLMDALKAEQQVHDDFKDHLDNKGLKDEIMEIVKANGYEPSVKKQAKKPISIPGTTKTLSQTFVDNTLNSFGIENLGNYEQVQEQVFDALMREGFFTDTASRKRLDTNEETGMVIETNKSGIDETFCYENYAVLGRFKKIVKLATIRELPNAIKYGQLIEDDVRNEHGRNRGTKYAYLRYDTQIDGIDVTLKITVRKSLQKNKFWVHSFEAIKNVSGTPADTNEGIKTGLLLADIGNIIHQEGAESQEKSINNSNATRGVYINDSTQAFTEQILNGEKTIETREQPKNRQYPELHKFIGKRIGIVRSGKGKTMLVGFATVSDEIVYNTEKEFRADDDKHLVKKGSLYDFKNKKYGYVLTDVERVTPWEIPKGSNRNGMSDVDITAYQESHIKKQLKKDSERDSQYMDAVNNNDMETAQRLVDEAAKEAGYNFKGFHGTARGGFTKFKTRLPGMLEGVESIFLSKDSSTASSYAYGSKSKVYSLFAKMERPLIVDCGAMAANKISLDGIGKTDLKNLVNKYVRDAWTHITGDITEASTDQIGYAALRSGEYDGVVFKTVIDSYYSNDYTDVYEVFTPEQVKSADPVTYDDKGNVIPLSERFNKGNDDIRYQKKRDPESSNRGILANALEGVAQNDAEKNKLKEYKEKISLIESEEKRLSEIQKQLFTKGAVDAEQRKELQFEAKQISNRINTYDRQLLRLEATKPLQDVLTREKELARKRQKQKDAEKLREYKEKVAKTTRELITRNQESRKKAIESREKTAIRHKIKSVVSDLNNLLLKPTKERHVPEEMRAAVAEALDLINMDTVDAETRAAKYNDLIANAKDPDVIASLTETRDRILNQGNKLSEKLGKLKDAYGTVRDSADDSISSMYDDVIYNKIESVQKKVGKTALRNMTLEQLEMVYDLYKMVLTTVRDSNKAFAEDLKMTRQALGSNTFAEIKENNKAKDRIYFEGIKRFGWKYLKPMQAIKTIGSETLQKLWNNVLYGQEVFAKDYDEAVKFAKEMKEKYGYKKWDLTKTYSFESKSGKKMKINLEQMMSIYAYSKRKQADEHIEYGGILLNESIIKEKNKLGKTVEVKVNDSTAYRLDKMQVAEIISTLEEKFPGAKDFVDEMQKYLSDVMGAKGNEVAMKMYGVKLFKEEHYFPLKSSKEFMEAANAKLKGDVKIKNKGMTKSTVDHARNPIVLEGFLDVWGNHVNEMAMYHGLVLPLEDLSRTLNYSFKADDNLNNDAESVRTAMHDAFGENADNYLNELLKAINGGVLRDNSAEIADNMISKFKKAKVMASLSVIVQQPTAIIRAMSIINPKYFLTTQNLKHKATWEEIKKYCPTAIIKETGSFDTNMGRTIVDMVKEDGSLTEKVGDVLGKAPAYMDEVGWNMIWRALKKKVATEQKLTGEELLKECGRQMTLIINETQVYDSVMSRNELMRSKGTFTKMATAFMGEPTTVANMIYGAALDFKRGKKGMASKTVAATISSVIINGLVSSLIYALRDDDEDETFLEKYISAATSETIDGLNPLTYIPFIKDAYSLFQGYDVERTDMALISDVKDAIDDFYNVLNPEKYEGMSGDEIKSHIYENSRPLLTAICDMFGLPVGNIIRDAEAIFFNESLPNSQGSSTGTSDAFKEGLFGALPSIVEKIVGTETKQDKLYEAIVSGDTAHVKRLKSGYKDDKAYESAVRKALRENDPRIREAAEARINGDIAEYTRIVKEIKAEGNFTQDTIVASVNTEINAINKDESSSTNATTDDKESSIYKIEDYFASIVGGDQASAYVVKEDIIKTDVANGKDRDEAEESFNSRFTSHVREQYEDGNLSENEAEKILVNYGGKSEEDAASKVQYWEFKQEYPGYDDLSEEAVDKYYNEVEPYGISIDVYYDYSKQRSECKGIDKNGDGKADSGSVKEEVLKVINSLPISRSQKDALYYLNGWSAKTINEAPWH